MFLDFRLMFIGGAIECANCGVKLSVNLANNREAIRAIKDAQASMATATKGQIKPF